MQMTLLLDDQLAPITSEMAFLEIAIEPLVDAFKRWQSRVMTPLGTHVAERAVGGSLRDALLRLLPLTSPRSRRYLFLPTVSSWVAVVENSTGGTDAGTLASFLSQELGSRGLRIAAVPHTKRDRKGQGRFGACVFELYGPGGEPRGHLRSIAVVNDGGAWSFTAHGKPLPFEHVENYSRRKITERFTFEELGDYAAALGLHPFDENFYRPDSARLVELTGAKPRGMAESSLEQVRASF